MDYFVTSSYIIIKQYALEYTNKNWKEKLYDYQLNHDILFIPDSDGFYLIVAKLSNGLTIDLTPRAIFETSYEEDTLDTLIPLN